MLIIPRAESDSCSSSDADQSCSPNAAPSDSDGNAGFDQSLFEKPGGRRYIGIGMVIGLFLIVFIIWLYRGKWPRRMLRQYGCCSCCSRRSQQPPESVVDDNRENSGTPTPILPTEKDRRRTLGDADRELVKEVSGGMVVFTKVPKALGGKDRYPVEWEMDHVNGIRLEVCASL